MFRKGVGISGGSGFLDARILPGRVPVFSSPRCVLWVMGVGVWGFLRFWAVYDFSTGLLLVFARCPFVQLRIRLLLRRWVWVIGRCFLNAGF